MNKKIQSALISVFYKEGLDKIVTKLHELNITIYSTGGTEKYINELGIPCVPVDSLTTYPSILGGRVKTLHPVIFGGILARRNVEQDVSEMKQYGIPVIDLVIVDLYPFEETLASYSSTLFSGSKEDAEKAIIEKIDVGGPSMIRAAAKNFADVVVVAAKQDYSLLVKMLEEQKGETTFEQRKEMAAKAFKVVMNYDIAISNYFNPDYFIPQRTTTRKNLRYGENPHQAAFFEGNLADVFLQIHGKEISYNNLVDIDAAIELIAEFTGTDRVFAIIKHTNVCGIAMRSTVAEAWTAALAGDPESAFGGVLVCNDIIDKQTAEAINEIFFEVLIAPSFDNEALETLQKKKNRILLQLKAIPSTTGTVKSVINGVLMQTKDIGNYIAWKEVGGRETSDSEKENLAFANIICKHLKSNAIALVTNKQLIGKGCGQTSRIDALRHAIEKAKQFHFDLHGAVLASDAFFPFNDCVQIAHSAGVVAFIQPGGSVRDNDSIEYCVENKLAMVITSERHFRH